MSCSPRTLRCLNKRVIVKKVCKYDGVFHMPSTSHYIGYSNLMKILAEKGHDVTVVSAHKEKHTLKNYKEVILTGVTEKFKETLPNFYNVTSSAWLSHINFIHQCTMWIEDVFSHPNFQAFMKSGQKFDAVILEAFHSEALKYVAYLFKAPLILLNPMDANEWVNHYQGNPESPAYTPSLHLLELSGNMSFFERVFNSFIYIYAALIREFIMIPEQNAMLHKYYPDAPHLSDFIYNVSIVLLNADPSVHEPQPKVPSMVNVGGFHIRQPKQLPEDLQEVLDNAKHGVIYFSMGTTLQSKYFPNDKLNLLLEAFSNLKETVLLKLEGKDLPWNPTNVVKRDWLPQNDILAHKNVKLFITHGGLFSSLEAVFHGVPILALPVFADQYANSKRAAAYGYSKFIPFREIDEHNFHTYLNDMLGNQTYKKNIIRRSKILTDKQMNAADSVNYWVEYVIRHQGAPHLRVASLNLSWYQCMLLDVVAFIAVVAILFIFIVRKIFCTMFEKKGQKEKIN